MKRRRIKHPVSPQSLANLRPAVKGEARNPAGRKTLGAFLSECLNQLAMDTDIREIELRKIAKNKLAEKNMRAAAQYYLMLLERPDIADYESVLDGQKSLAELRADGIDTALVKKMKQKTRSIPNPEGGETTEVEREIELHDRSLDAFNVVLNRTDGRPHETQEVDINVSVSQLTDAELIERAERLFGGASGSQFVDVPAIAAGQPEPVPQQPGQS